MAEKYGVVPPKFTKAWWEYFWEYYKIHTIAIGFIVIAVVTTAVQCATKEKFDLTMTYAGKLPITTEMSDKAEELCEPFIEDVDANGEKNIFFQVMTISGERGFEEYDYALTTKLQLEYQMENSFIFMYDEKQLETMMNLDYVGEMFLPVSEWAGDVDESKIVKAPNGVGYAVDISGSKLFNDNGIICEGTYLTIKLNNKPEQEPAFEGSKSIAKEIIK